jgi:hypothetical protein
MPIVGQRRFPVATGVNRAVAVGGEPAGVANDRRDFIVC